MNQSNLAAPAPAPSAHPARSGAILAALAASFAAGLLLLAALTDGGDMPFTAGQADAVGDAPLQRLAVTRESADDATAQVRAPAAVEVKLTALEADLADTRARLERIAAQAGDAADTAERLHTLETELAAVRRVADKAAARATEVTRRSGGLAADYAKLGARFTPDGVLIRLDETAVGFPPGSATLPSDAGSALAEIAGFLQRHPERQVLLRGHTDATGGAAANLALSEARARAVRDALVALGIEPGRLEAEGVGAAEPIADNATADGRSRNRRVDLLLDLPDATAS